MKVVLRRIKKDCYDDLKKKTIEEYNSTGVLAFEDLEIEKNSEPVLLYGQPVEVDFDIDQYKAIAAGQDYGYTKFAKIGMLLHRDLSSAGTLPRNLFYEKEFWAYLSLTCFFDIVRELRLKDDGKINEDKIARFYFNVGGISRTGLLFIWALIDKLDSSDNYEITHTAFEFIDPVKAIFERTMGKNPVILKAFVQGIINNEKNSLFKGNEFRSKVPSNISCYASINMLDALEYDELVEVITKQQKLIISTRKRKSFFGL